MHLSMCLVIIYRYFVVLRTIHELHSLYPGRDTFEFDEGHMTKNQPITVLILLSESLGIYQFMLLHDKVVLR